jgi:hypothetical protein
MMRPIPAALRHASRLLSVMVFGGAGLLLIAPGQGCADEGIGDPCTPEQEYSEDFLGFDEKEVNVESKSFQCRTRLCLVNHFKGRVSCPYGQEASGEPPPNGTPCTVPGSTKRITGAKDAQGNFRDTIKQSKVEPQCLDRSADKAVYCSCRCADINGNKPSDQTFCTCPDGFQCERLVTSIGQGNEGLTGSYCIKTDTKYDPTTACTQGQCDKNDKSRQCN